MSSTPINNPPIRITDLIELKRKGSAVTCTAVFDIIPVDFTHRTCQFQALAFICLFSGKIDWQQYSFRKCYARMCTQDLCPCVSQRRYDRQSISAEQGASVEKDLFSLEESLIKLLDIKEDPGQALIIDDYIQMAKGGSRVSVDIALEYVHATDHFEYHKSHQTFEIRHVEELARIMQRVERNGKSKDNVLLV